MHDKTQDTSAVDWARAPRASEIAKVYEQLKRAARGARRVNPQNTLNTTALVHEAWLKLEQSRHQTGDRSHYLRTAALAMRQLLVDYARFRGSARRDRAAEMPLVETGLAEFLPLAREEILSLDQALDELAGFDARAAEVVLLRFFGGLSISEAAETMQISVRSASRDWTRARAFLKTRLAES